MESLISDNDFDCAIQQVEQQDRLSRVSTSHRYRFHGMYALIDDKIQNHRNVIIQKDKTKAEIADYLHACCLFPVLSTFDTTVKKDISPPDLV